MEDLDSEQNIILGGDFSCPVNPALDKHGRGCLKNNQYLVLKGASVYGKVTLIKSLLIPKIVYTSSLLPTPEHNVKDLNHILYMFYGKVKIK